MANRYPLIIDSSDGNKIKELQPGDNLNLSGNDIISVNDITATGAISASDVLIGGKRVSGFSGDYDDLTNKPTPVTSLLQLNDVTDSSTAGHVLATDGAGNFVFTSVESVGELNVQSDWNVTNANSDAFIKNKPELFSGDYNDLSNKPTFTTTLAELTDVQFGEGFLRQGSNGTFAFVDFNFERDEILSNDTNPTLSADLILNDNNIIGPGSILARRVFGDRLIISGMIDDAQNLYDFTNLEVTLDYTIGPSGPSVGVFGRGDGETRGILSVPVLNVGEARVEGLQYLRFTGDVASRFVNKISDDPSLTEESSYSLVTENAVKSYVDSAILPSNTVSIVTVTDNPTRITTQGNHGVSNGQTVTITGIVPGGHYLNNNSYYAKVLSETGIELYTDEELENVLTGEVAIYSSGGSVIRGAGANIFNQSLNSQNDVVFNSVFSSTSVTASSILGDLYGSVFGDDSKPLIDSTESKIVGDIESENLKITNSVDFSEAISISGIPSALTDLGITDGTSGQFLQTDGDGGFTFATIAQQSVPSDLTDLGITDGSSGQFLQTDGEGSFTFADLPTIPTSLTDLGITDGTPGQILTTNGFGTFSFQNPSESGDSIGNFTLADSIIDTDDSSEITFTPPVRLSSDLWVDNGIYVGASITFANDCEVDFTGSIVRGLTVPEQNNQSLNTDDNVTFNSITAESFAFTGTLSPTFTSSSDFVFNTGTGSGQLTVNGSVEVSSVLNLSAQSSEPVAVSGSFAVADGVNWDPGSKADTVPYPVFYDGVSWNALY